MKKFSPRSIFISYNHDESRNIAGRIYERLASRLTPAAVFKDDENATRRLGFDFRKTFEAALKDCRVVLVVIDQGWYERRMLSEKQGDDMPPDWVRIEVESALNTPGLAVIPLMVDGADFPKNKPLPGTMTDLRYRDGKRIPSDEGFGPSMDDLVRHLEALLLENSPPRLSSSQMFYFVLCAVAVFLGLGAWGLWRMTEKTPDAQISAAEASEVASREAGKKTETAEGAKPTLSQFRFLTLDGDEVVPSTEIKATAHRAFSMHGYGMSLYLLLDNHGMDIVAPLSGEFYLPKELQPKRPVGGGTNVSNGTSGLTWKWRDPYFMPQKIEKGQAAEDRGYALIPVFCPIDESSLRGKAFPVAFNIMASDGTILIGSRFLVNVQDEMVPKARMEYQTMNGQDSPGGCYIEGRLENSTLRYPLFLTWEMKYKSSGLLAGEKITTVIQLPKALRPPAGGDSSHLDWAVKSGLPWAYYYSWTPEQHDGYQISAGSSPIDKELLDGFEAGYYHFRVLDLRNTDLQSFLKGELKRESYLFDRYYIVNIVRP